MGFNKVIYIRYIPLTAKIYEDFYFQQVMDSGIKVEYWDISKLFFKSGINQEDSSYLCTTLYFNSYRQLEENINKVDKLWTLFIPIMTLDGGQRNLYCLFTRYHCKFGIFGRNMFPQSPFSKRSLLKRLGNITLSQLINYRNNRCVVKEMSMGKIKNYDVIFLGGNNGWKGIGHINHEQVIKTQNIQINSDDYDHFLRIKENTNRLVKGKYILFLDEYLPLHPDTKLFSIGSIQPEEYYPQLNAYFDRVEKQFEMPVIIAAHPKALRYKEENFFERRQIYFGNSAILCRYAEFVITHDSTSVNYAVAFGKKLHFITSKSIEKKMKSVHQNVICFAKYLDCNIQYFDQPDEPVNLIEVLNEERYRAYKYDFQTSVETENTLSEKIFIDYLKK